MSGARTVAIVAAVLGLVMAGGIAAVPVRAAPTPTLTILSPANNAVIGNGSPVAVLFTVTNFNLTVPGTGGSAPDTGHVDVYVDGALASAASTNDVVLPLPSGPHAILLRLVTDNDSPLIPDVRASVSVMVTRGPVGETPGLSVVFPANGTVLGTDFWVDFSVRNFALVPLGSPPGVPGEGHVQVYLDGDFYAEQTTDDAIHLSLPDGSHHVLFELVDSGSQALSPNVTASVVVNVKALIGRTIRADVTPYLAGANIVIGLAILAAIYRKLEV